MSESHEISRRQFVAVAATCVAACACGSALAQIEKAPVDIGTVADYPSDAIYGKFVKTDRIIVYRESGQIYASTALCPHRGALMMVRGDEVYCPKHGSEFSPAGTVTHGPAEDSLIRYAIKLDDNKHLIVDPSKSFREKSWDDPASFVAVK